MSRRVFLHVGAPKTGTSYLQSTLAANRTTLAAHGLSYPQTESGGHFEAAIDLIDHPWGGLLKGARGEWDKVAASALRAPGDAIISHEVLAAATPEQVRRAQASLVDAEVHLIYTARDLGRQIPAEWQETLKHRGRRRFTGYLKSVIDAPRVGSEEWFWRVQHLPDVLGRWTTTGLRPDRLHVITVPPSGAERGLLWRRFAGVLGLDPDLQLEAGDRENASLGMIEAATLRRINIALRGRGISPPVYAEMVRELIARDTFGPREGQERATLPPYSKAFVEEVTDEWLDWIAGSGVALVGDVDELRTAWPADGEEWVNPDKLHTPRLLDAAVEALAAVVQHEDRKRRQSRSTGLRRRLGL